MAPRNEHSPEEAPGLSRGRGERIRTSDPIVPNDVRYQAALRPDAKNDYSASAAGPSTRALHGDEAGRAIRQVVRRSCADRAPVAQAIRPAARSVRGPYSSSCAPSTASTAPRAASGGNPRRARRA
jgi:hypothetical protein